MAPIRRYLRITKYSVLECRIYLDNPALTQSWLLNPRDPVLPRVIESVRPLVLPKLLEEKEREASRRKGKKRSIKDVIVEDEFEVSIFLTETDTRHSLLHKQKHFRDKVQTKLTSNSSKLVGESREAPIDVDNSLLQEAAESELPILREESEDRDISLQDIPAVDETSGPFGTTNQRPKRRRAETITHDQGHESGQSSDADDVAVEIHDTDSSSDELFVAREDPDNSDAGVEPPPKRRKDKATTETTEPHDDKKKLAIDISYEGFAIYGRVLCLVVKRRGGGNRGAAASMTMSGNKPHASQPGGQAMMENWITSTQLPDPAAAEDDAL